MGTVYLTVTICPLSLVLSALILVRRLKDDHETPEMGWVRINDSPENIGLAKKFIRGFPSDVMEKFE